MVHIARSRPGSGLSGSVAPRCATGAAPTRAAAEAAIDVFADKYGDKYNKAVACLTRDREALLAFFDFPAEHWDHLRTSNPIESVFATVRHRTVRTKGALSAQTAKLMVFKLVNAAAKTWRRLNGENQLPKVVQGVKFKNGIEVTTVRRCTSCWRAAASTRKVRCAGIELPGHVSQGGAGFHRPDRYHAATGVTFSPRWCLSPQCCATQEGFAVPIEICHRFGPHPSSI